MPMIANSTQQPGTNFLQDDPQQQQSQVQNFMRPQSQVAGPGQPTNQSPQGSMQAAVQLAAGQQAAQQFPNGYV